MIIQEDYVSFETAKLLKKNGFDSPCELQYINCSSGHPFLTDRRDDAGCYYKNSEIEQDEYSVPTLQMAMKWLRKEHKLEIYPFHHKGYPKDKWGYNIKKEMPLSIIDKIQKLAIFDSYEESCDVAIQYCLVHLI